MKLDFGEEVEKMNNVCPFSRQIEGYCESDRKKSPPNFLTEHYETCEKCRPQFLKFGKELERLEVLIPQVKKEDIKEEEENILKNWNQFRRKRKRRLFFF